MQRGDLLFVYGTLRKGESADLSKDARAAFKTEAKINGLIYDCGWYPGVKASAEKEFTNDLPVVYGDLFEILDDSLVSRLDRYEGYPSLYDRLQTTADNGDRVWVYIFNPTVKDDARVVSGDWKDVSHVEAE